MKVHYLILTSAMLFAFIGVASAENCVSCAAKEVAGMPTSGKSMGVMEKIAKKAAESEAPQSEYLISYCMQFQQLGKESIG